jgi:tetratricopeptide (TPR) repeat protein
MSVPKNQPMMILAVMMLALLVLAQATPADQAEQWYGQANASYQQGNYSAAVQKLRQVTSIKPDSGSSWLLMAQCYVELNKLDDAKEAITRALKYLDGGTTDQSKAIKLLETIVTKPPVPAPEKPPSPDTEQKPPEPPSPPEPTIERQLSEAFSAGEWARVIELGEKIVKGKPDSPLYAPAHYYVGKAYLDLDRDPIKGIQYLRKYLDQWPDGTFADAIRKIIDELDSHAFDVLVAEMEEALELGQLGIARAKLGEAKNMRKEGHDLTYLEGLQFVLDGQEGRALECFERYLLDAPSGRFADRCNLWIIQLRSPWLLVIRDGQVMRIFTDGTKPRPISRPLEQGQAEQAIVSPDGREIAFVTWNEKPNTRNVFVSDAFGNEPHGIFECQGGRSAIRDLHWFKHDTGLWLTFVAEDRTRDYGVFLYGASRSSSAFMLEGSRCPPDKVSNLHCRWSPDTEFLA